MEKKERYYFGFRFEKKLEEDIREFLDREGRRRSGLLGIVLEMLADLHDRGRICLTEKSGFLQRIDVKDKTETVLILTPGQHEMLRNLAFTYRSSMAEVLRLGMELFFDRELRGKLVKAIHYYGTKKALVKLVIFRTRPAMPPGKPQYPLII